MHLSIGNTTLQLIIKKYRKQKNMRLRVLAYDSKVVVTAPRFVTNREIEKFVQSQIDWIHQQLVGNPLRFSFDQLWLWGKVYQVKWLFGMQSGYQLWSDRVEFLLTLPLTSTSAPTRILDSSQNPFLKPSHNSSLKPPQNPSLHPSLSPIFHLSQSISQKALDRFYLDQITQQASKRVLFWNEKLKTPVKKVVYRKMYSRWGSCSPDRQRICLNTLLAKYDQAVLDYVIVHELCHFFEKFHNQRFYQLIEHCLPNWRQLAKQII